MRLSLYHVFAPPPTGGGHQFLRALCREWERRGIRLDYNRARHDTAAVLFNSYNFDMAALRVVASERPDLRRVHRVDGPLATYRGLDDGSDRRIHAINREAAHASIFQSRFSLEKHRELGLEPVAPALIPNAPDPEIFYPTPRPPPAPGHPLRVIAASWSDNPNKGADVFAWLDAHLDPERFTFTFIGRSAHRFRRWRALPPMDSQGVAEALRAHDVYLAASRHDPCSNALLEALACGLPALYRDSGGHPELVGEAGLPFARPEEIPELLERLAAEWRERRDRIRTPDIRDVAERYLEALRIEAPRPPPMIVRGAGLRARARETVRWAARRRWRPASRLMLIEDRPEWVIGEEMRALRRLAHRLGIRLIPRRWRPFAEEQAIFYGSQFFLFSDDWLYRPQRVAVAYFHGRPGSGFADFDRLYDRLRAFHGRLDRVQVSHREMEEWVLRAGLAPDKVFRIPIGLDIGRFPLVTEARRAAARRHLGIPADAFVVGSFQKDGSGWGDGREPKLIKGPDVLLEVAEGLRARVPPTMFLLSGPARGYVTAGLAQRGVPYLHRRARRYAAMAELYAAIDAYLVPARQEGGPKAVLEALASGIPLVTTRVGQAADLVEHRRHGWIVDVEDVAGLTDGLAWVATRPRELDLWRGEGRRLAEQHDYLAQLPLWRRFFEGFVEMSD